MHFIGHRAAPGCASNFMKPFLEVWQYYLTNGITKSKIGGDEIIKKIIKNVIYFSIYLHEIVINLNKMMPT